jgi:hypothetical protein
MSRRCPSGKQRDRIARRYQQSVRAWRPEDRSAYFTLGLWRPYDRDARQRVRPSRGDLG